jgi:hypothetical protein
MQSKRTEVKKKMLATITAKNCELKNGEREDVNEPKYALN